MAEFNLIFPPDSQVDRRVRGEHSTVCKCPRPEWVPPERYKLLPGEIGRIEKLYFRTDSETGKKHLCRSYSSHPYFVKNRERAGRKRSFRPEKKYLMDAVCPLLMIRADISTWIASTNVTALANELSPKDAQGNIIPEIRIEPSRISRLLDEMVSFDLIKDITPEWDHGSNLYHTRVIVLTDAFWEIGGADMDKLYRQRLRRQLAESDNSPEAGTEAYTRAARRRHIEYGRIATMKKRRTHASAAKYRSRLAGKALDERRVIAAQWVMRNMPAHELERMDTDAFNRKAWQHLNQLKLGIGSDPPTRH